MKQQFIHTMNLTSGTVHTTLLYIVDTVPTEVLTNYHEPRYTVSRVCDLCFVK